MKSDHLMAQAVADRVGATKRQVQMWTDAGVLACLPETDRKGRGRQRLYERSELPLAALVAELVKMQLPIGTLLALSNYVRENLNRSKEGDFYSTAIRGETPSWLLLTPPGEQEFLFGWCDYQETIETLENASATLAINVQRVIQSADISEESTTK